MALTAVFKMKDDVSSILKGIARNTETSENSFKKLGSTVSNVAKGFLAFKGIEKIGEGIKVGILNNAEIETASTAWETLLGSQEKAATMIKDISKYAAKTPFSKMGVDFMAKQLHNAGFEGEKMFEQMTMMGDLGGAFGLSEDSLKELVKQYGQVQQATVAYTEDLNILQDRGIPIYKALADVTGKPVKEIKKMASEGKITSDIYNEAIKSMADKTKGSMDKQSQTFSGLKSSLEDNFSDIMGIVSKPIFNVLKSNIDSLITVMGTVDWNAIGEKVANAINIIITAGTELKDFFMSELLPRFVEIGEKLQELVSMYFPSTSGGFDGLKVAASNLVTGGLNLVKSALQWMIDNQGVVKGILISLGTAYTVHAVAVGISNAALIAHNISVGASIAIDWALNAAIIALYAQDYILAAAHGIVTAAQWALNAAMSANPIALVVGLIVGLIAIFVSAYNSSETFRNGVNALWEGLKSGAESAINFVINKINWLTSKLNSVINLINKIPGVEIGEIGKLEEVNFTAHAKGTKFHPGGNALVGEAGAELVTGPAFGDLPRGSKVYNAKETEGILENKGTSIGNVNINVTSSGNDKEELARFIWKKFNDKLEEEILLGGNA